MNTAQNAVIKTSIPGPKSLSLRRREDQVLAPGLQAFALMAGIAVEKAYGSIIEDVDGNQFIDLIGGIGVGGLGHSHPKWVNAVKTQVEKASVGSFTSEPRVKLFEKLHEHRPHSSIDRVQLYSSGAEAVESALRLAKAHTGKSEFVSFWGGFHGKTMGVLSLMGSDFKDSMGPFVPGSHIVPYANPYRPHEGLEGGAAVKATLALIEEQIRAKSSGGIAAFIIEPMQGTAGNIIPPKEFLPEVQKLARKFGALLIVDEMITGFGRTGKYWGSEHTGVEPDIVTLGKQFGGGFPISAVFTKTEIAKAKPWSNPSGSSSSYGGNPLAAAAALSALEIIDSEKLVENSRATGEHFLSRLRDLKDKYSFIGDVRGLGLFLAIEFVEDREAKTPLAREQCRFLFDECLKRGLLTMAYTSSFRIQPAMTISKATIDNAVGILDEVFALFQKTRP